VLEETQNKSQKTIFDKPVLHSKKGQGALGVKLVSVSRTFRNRKRAAGGKSEHNNQQRPPAL